MLAVPTLVLAALLPFAVTDDSASEPAAARRGIHIEILKGQRKLLLYEGEELIARYPIGLGGKPVGTKRREGDQATPEGAYTVCVKNPQSRYFLSLGLTYPSEGDARRGLADGLIDRRDYERIARAVERGTCPPWDTALGGEIFIHGRGSGTDWTLGCVALDDPDMETLFHTARVGTRVVIRP